MPAIVKARPVALAATAHAVPPPSVIVTTPLDWAADATVQPPNPLVRTTVGDAGTENAGSNVTRIFDAVASAPVELASKPTLQVERAPAVCGAPVKDTFAGVDAAVMVTPLAGDTGVVSRAVATVKPPAPTGPVDAGLVIPVICNVPAVLAASAQPLPTRVTVTV
jgi:hypothetical protein